MSLKQRGLSVPSTRAASSAAATTISNSSRSRRNGVTTGAGPSKVSLEDFDVKKVIGRGSFGKVFLVQKKSDGKVYAMKMLLKSLISLQGEIEHTMTEQRVMARLSNPFIAKLYYSFQTETHLHLIMDFINGGELFQHLCRSEYFTEERSRFYTAEILLGVEYLHANGIVYRDLKPENILLDSNGHIVLVDFGLSKQGLEGNQRTGTLCGTPQYIAPEILLGNTYTKSVDWWSLGLLVYEMICGYNPFDTKETASTYELILHAPIDFPEWFTEDAADFVASLLNRDPDSRPTPEVMKKHKWFICIDWEKLSRKAVDPPFLPSVADRYDTSEINSELLEEGIETLDDPMNEVLEMASQVDVNQDDFGGFTYQPSAPEEPSLQRNLSLSGSLKKPNKTLKKTEKKGSGFMKRPTNMRKRTLEDFEVKKVIGRGSFGKVFLVEGKEDKKLYAMKMLAKSTLARRGEIEHTRTEMEVMATLENPFIAKLHFSFQNEHFIYFIMDFINGGELWGHLCAAGYFTEERTRFYTAEIIIGIGYLHENGIIYRDLKPENVCLDKQGHIVLIDFGLSKQGLKGADSQAVTICGTTRYMAPEIINGNPYTKVVDWWSLGLMVYEMIAGYNPFDDGDESNLYGRILSLPIEYSEEYFSADAIAFISSLLERDPTLRNSYPQMKLHRWFHDIDWVKLSKKSIDPPFVPSVTSEEDLSQMNPELLSESIERLADDDDNPNEEDDELASALPKIDDSDFMGFTYAPPDKTVASPVPPARPLSPSSAARANTMPTRAIPKPGATTTTTSTTTATVASKTASPGPSPRNRSGSGILAQARSRSRSGQLQAPVRKVSLDDFEIQNVIGRGSYGKVFLVHKKDTKQVYAMKMLAKSMLAIRGEIQHTLNELSVMSSLDNPFIAKIHFSFHNDSHIYFVLDFINGGELYQHLCAAEYFTEDRTRFYAGELILGIEYLHDNGVIYRDLKPENVLLDKEGHIVLVDFGLSKQGLEGHAASTTTMVGTPQYIAPEIINGDPYTKSVDWWSLGLMLYEMIAGYSPFYTENTSELYGLILNAPITYPSDYFSANATDFISGILNRDGKARSTPAMMKNHPWFDEMDWTRLAAKQIPPPFVPTVKNSEDVSAIRQEYLAEVINGGNLADPEEEEDLNVTINKDDFMGFTYSPQLNKAAQVSPSAPKRRTLASGGVSLGRTRSASGAQMKITKPTVVLEDFIVQKVIGRGSFGKVFLVKRKNTNIFYAMKVLQKSMLKARGEIEHTMTERDVLMALDHPFIAKLRFSFQTEFHLYFVLDFINGGEIYYHLCTEQYFSEDKTRFYAAEIILALGYLHKKGIVYRDLKPENILLDKDGHIVMVDFGLAKQGLQGNASSAATICGTPQYMAPEILKGDPYTKSVDFWSLGVMLFEMIGGYSPFYTENPAERYGLILHQEVEYPPEWFSPAATSCIAGLLTRDPKKRLTHVQLLSHEWFSCIDWTLLEKRQIPPPLVPTLASPDDISYLNMTALEGETLALDDNEFDNNQAKTSDDFMGFTYVGSK